MGPLITRIFRKVFATDARMEKGVGCGVWGMGSLSLSKGACRREPEFFPHAKARRRHEVRKALRSLRESLRPLRFIPGKGSYGVNSRAAMATGSFARASLKMTGVFGSFPARPAGL